MKKYTVLTIREHGVPIIEIFNDKTKAKAYFDKISNEEIKIANEIGAFFRVKRDEHHVQVFLHHPENGKPTEFFLLEVNEE